jgi:hypothetical protein
MVGTRYACVIRSDCDHSQRRFPASKRGSIQSSASLRAACRTYCAGAEWYIGALTRAPHPGLDADGDARGLEELLDLRGCVAAARRIPFGRPVVPEV